MAKPRITSELFRELLFNELNKESSHSSSKSNFYEHIRTTYSIAKQRSLQLYDIYYHEWAAIRRKEVTSATVTKAKEDAEKGLKSKEQRMLDIQELLYKGEHEEVVINIISGRAIKYKRKLSPKEIQMLHAELSKMDGSYAAIKQDVAIKELPPAAIINFDGSKIEILQ